MTKKRLAAKSWRITCDQNTFKKCLKDGKFPYIVTLARAVNALNSASALLAPSPKIDTPASVRNRINSYLFSAALLYEAIQLTKKMNKVFLRDTVFQSGIKNLLKDPIAQGVERLHLKPSRHAAVFHFDPETFAQTITKKRDEECVFISARGRKNKNLHFAFADVLAVEIHVGLSSEHGDFYAKFEKTVGEMTDLIIRFSTEANSLIVHYLKEWGFERADI